MFTNDLYIFNIYLRFGTIIYTCLLYKVPALKAMPICKTAYGGPV